MDCFVTLFPEDLLQYLMKKCFLTFVFSSKHNLHTTFNMGEPVSRPSELKNKHKRENLYQKQRLEKQKAKATKRKQLAKAEEKNPELKKVSDPDLQQWMDKCLIDDDDDRNVWKRMFPTHWIIPEKRMRPW